MRPQVWNARRKWMGNLIPLAWWAPFMAVGALTLHKLGGKDLALGLAPFVAAPAFAWIALNQTGLFENGKMRRALEKELRVLKPLFEGFQVFVGYASPRYSSLLDPHEDVGFLLLSPNSLEFIGDSRSLFLERKQIFRVRFRRNIHSLLGLGRWICIEGRVEGKPFEMRIEPRERKTLLGNARFGKFLKAEIEAWLKGNEPRAD